MSELEIINNIVFDCNYPKLHNQKSAVLVSIFGGATTELLQQNFPLLVSFDTNRGDGAFYDLKQGQEYLLLLFVGDKGIMFSSLRKANEENKKFYNDRIGEVFNLVIIEDK